MKRAIIVLSGGLDSAVALAIAVNEGYLMDVLTVDYGQRNRRELECVRKLVEHYWSYRPDAPDADRPPGVLSVVQANLGLPLNSGITVGDHGIRRVLSNEQRVAVPVGDKGAHSTFVPGRNAMFLAMAFALAESRNVYEVWTGAIKGDDFGPAHPDSTPQFFEGMQRALNEGTNQTSKITIRNPCIGWNKTEVVREALLLGVPIVYTRTCHDDKPEPCGVCGACASRAHAFAELGVTDITVPITRGPK